MKQNKTTWCLPSNTRVPARGNKHRQMAKCSRSCENSDFPGRHHTVPHVGLVHPGFGETDGDLALLFPVKTGLKQHSLMGDRDLRDVSTLTQPIPVSHKADSLEKVISSPPFCTESAQAHMAAPWPKK